MRKLLSIPILALALMISVKAPRTQTVRTYASQIPGVVLDANLSGPNTQTCTDNTVKLNAVLATATSAHPVDLVMDGATCLYNITPSGSRGLYDIMCLDLRGLSNVTIEGQGWGTGFLVKDGEHCAAISNYTVYPGPAADVYPSRTMGNYVFRNFQLVGASDVGSSGVVNGLKIFDAQNIVVENVKITNVNYSFGTVWGNVGNVSVTDSQILQPSTSGTDPVHFDGPADHITLKRLKLQSPDDCVALNAPEGQGGAITDVYMEATTMAGSGCGDFMRIYNYVGPGYNGGRFYGTQRIVVDGVYGTATCAYNPSIFYFGEAGHSGTDNLNDLQANHIDVDGSGNCQLAWFQGTWDAGTHISDWVMRNPKPGVASVLLGGGLTSTTLTFNNGVLMRGSSGQSTAWPFQVQPYSNTSVNLNLTNIFALDSGGVYAAAPQLLDVSSTAQLGTLTIGSPMSKNGKITNLLSTGSFAKINSVVGSSNFGAVPTDGTNTQAIITYTCSTVGTVVFSTSATYASGVLSSPVDDTNETLFPGSTVGNRAGSGIAPNNANLHYFVAGTRKPQLASDGQFHSRALPANSLLYYQVNCGGTILPSSGSAYTIHTSNIPGNETYSEIPTVDSTTGFPIIPTVPNTRNFDFIDYQHGSQIRNMYLTTDASSTPNLYSGGTIPPCAQALVGPGPGWLCSFPADGGGAAMLYYIIPNTREIRYLGSMQIPSSGPWPACGSSSLGYGILDDQTPTYVWSNVDYVVGGSCSPGPPQIKSAIVRGHYTDATFSAVSGGSTAAIDWTLITPSPVFIPDLIHAFDSSFDVSKFPSCSFAQQGQYAYSECRRSSQASYAWYAVFDMGDRQPLDSCTNCMHVIGAVKYDNPVNRWTGTHNGSLAPGDANMAYIIPGYSEGCAYNTSVKPCDPTLYPQLGMGPYAMKLTTDITTSTATFTVSGQPLSLSDYVIEPSLMNVAVGDQCYLCPGTTLTAAITSTGQTTIQVVNGSQFVNGDRIFVGANPTETFRIVSGGGTNIWVVTRGTDGSTASTYSSGTGVAKWYNDCRHNEVMTITNISSFPSITVSRATPSVYSASAWSAGSNLVMNGQRQSDAGVHYIWWSFLTAPHGESLGFIPEANPHFYGQHADWGGRYITEAYYDRDGSLESQISQPASLQIDPSVPYQAVPALGPGVAYTRYPTYEKLLASYLNQQWFLDYPHFQGGDPFSAIPGAVLQGGTTQIYKYVFCTVAANNCGGSESLLHRRQHPTWSRAGDHLLTDVSGPGSSIADGSGGAWTYCVANSANECRAGSSIGDAYANIPGLTDNYCRSLEHPDSRVDWCLVDATFSGHGVTQFSLIPGTNGYGRKLTSMLSPLGSPDAALAKASPDGGLTFFRTRPDRMFMATNPPFRFIPDEYDRTTFIPVSVTVPPTGLSLPSGTTTVRADFGYQEFGGNCTTRNEPCVSVTSGSVPSTPFSFDSENPSRLACASGCTLTIPALSSRTLYATIKYYNSGGTLLRTDTLPPQIIAPFGYDPGDACRIIPDSLGNGTVAIAYVSTLGVLNCGTATLGWNVTSGSLPPGLTLNSTTGNITGTPTTANTYTFTIHVTDGLSNSADVSYSLTISGAGVCTISTASLPSGLVGSAYSQGLSLSNCGSGPFTWDVSVGSLPGGISLNTSSGVISGTPSGAGTSNFTIHVVDSGANFASQPYSLTIASLGTHRSLFSGGSLGGGGVVIVK